MQNIAIQSTDFKNRFSDLKQINFPSWMDAANVSGFVWHIEYTVSERNRRA